MLRTFNNMDPQIAESAYVDDTAVVIGDVVIESEASVWPHATLRGDSGQIVVEAGANVQDNAVLHENTVIEQKATVGHSAIVHAATVARGALVGMNAVVLDETYVGEDAIVGAGAVVTEGTDIDPGTLVTGTPAEPTADLDNPPSSQPAEHYILLAKEHEQTSKRID